MNEVGFYLTLSLCRFTVAKDPRGATLKRGTQVTLHLKEEAYDFLEADTLKNLVEKYSQFINFNIYLWQSKVIWRGFIFFSIQKGCCALY